MREVLLVVSIVLAIVSIALAILSLICARRSDKALKKAEDIFYNDGAQRPPN
jgi:hypothetical protein